MDVVRPLCGLALIGGQLQPVLDVDALDDKDVPFLLNLANRVRTVGIEVRRYSARLKGAA